MNAPRRSLHPSLWIGLLAAGLLLSATLAVRGVRSELKRLRGVSAALTEMEALRARVESEEIRLRRRFGLPARPLKDVVGEGLMDSVELVPGETVDLAEGYRTRDARIEFLGLRWDQLRDLLTRLENGTPPWRVVALNIQADVKDLSGNLAVQVLERPE